MNQEQIKALLQEAAVLNPKSAAGATRLNQIASELIADIWADYRYLANMLFYKTMEGPARGRIFEILFPFYSLVAGIKDGNKSVGKEIDWEAYLAGEANQADLYLLSDDDWDAVLGALPLGTRETVRSSLRKANNAPLTIKQIGLRGAYGVINGMLEAELIPIRLEKQKRDDRNSPLTYRFKKSA